MGFQYDRRACFQNTERGRPRPQQRTYDRQFSRTSNDLAIGQPPRPRTGALRFHFENTLQGVENTNNAKSFLREPLPPPRLCVNSDRFGQATASFAASSFTPLKSSLPVPSIGKLSTW